jgi:hypothetical protein
MIQQLHDTRLPLLCVSFSRALPSIPAYPVGIPSPVSDHFYMFERPLRGLWIRSFSLLELLSGEPGILPWYGYRDAEAAHVISIFCIWVLGHLGNGYWAMGRGLLRPFGYASGSDSVHMCLSGFLFKGFF